MKNFKQFIRGATKIVGESLDLYFFVLHSQMEAWP